MDANNILTYSKNYSNSKVVYLLKFRTWMRSILSVLVFGSMIQVACQEADSIDPTMVFVQGGLFLMGTDSLTLDSLVDHYGFPEAYLASEFPPHEISLNSFFIDKTEVTNAGFRKFLLGNSEWQKGKLPDSLHNGNYLQDWNDKTYPPGEDDFPVVNVTWHSAVAYCQCQNKRLPTEAEWEYVARNQGDMKKYPWGNEEPDSTKANFHGGIGRPLPVKTFPPNELGVFDLAGNVWEFTLDEWSQDYYKNSPSADPVNGHKNYSDDDLLRVETRRIIRGGSWGGSPVNLRTRFRDSHPPNGAGDHVGFRCVKEVTS
ncbi:MAG: formylglycine-generating enzyme family protein [Saprospiraceae bacterium]|nr:formylglycine-generating enzyme family protein [Saprospiraceae bacterium]